MNYEDLYQNLQPDQKNVKDSLALLQKLFKAVGREVESGDLKSLTKDLSTMAETAKALSASLEGLQDTVGGFDTKAYFESGDFAQQMLEICEEKGVDVRGDSPVFEMFPYKVKLDVEMQDLYMDRKKVQCMRPQSFVETVKQGQEKLNKAGFNADTFAGELSEAYNIALLKMGGKKPGTDVYLSNLYKILAPMSRFRKDYDQQSFAFDLARLYNSGTEETKNGRRFQFGSTRDGKKSIRILDKNGQERFLATICFYD